jgi:hypothetical protein
MQDAAELGWSDVACVGFAPIVIFEVREAHEPSSLDSRR